MSNDQARLSRRGALLTVGAASLGVLSLTPGTAEASKHPRLDSAIDQMKDARKYLDKAPDKFGGHKAKALAALDTAIEEIKAAIKFAEKN